MTHYGKLSRFLLAGSEKDADLKRFLSIFSDFIFDSSVDPGIPNLTAAPDGARHLSLAFCQRSLYDRFLLRRRKLSYEATLPAWASCLEIVEKASSRRLRHSLFHSNDGSLDHVLQFTNIIGPGIRLKQSQALFIHSLKAPYSFPCETIDKVLHQEGMSSRRSRNGGISIGKTFSR